MKKTDFMSATVAGFIFLITSCRRLRSSRMQNSLLVSLAVFLAASFTSPLMANTGDFRVQNYATGTGNGNFWWRGYLFKPSREVVVVGMWGGTGQNCNEFAGAILEAELTGNPAATNPSYNIKGLLANVSWTAPGTNNTPEYKDFASPITLYPDKYYFIGQGQDTGNSGSGCHFNTSFLDFENLEIGSAIISEWYPRSQHQYYPSAQGLHIGNGSQLVNSTHGAPGGNVGDDGIDPVRILVGFRYQTDVVLADFLKCTDHGNTVKWN